MASDQAAFLFDVDNTLVDNDHGLVLPVEEIRKRIQSGRKWQTASV